MELLQRAQDVEDKEDLEYGTDTRGDELPKKNTGFSSFLDEGRRCEFGNESRNWKHIDSFVKVIWPTGPWTRDLAMISKRV